MPNTQYDPRDFGKKEEALKQQFDLQFQDARDYFLNQIKPRLDKSYKLYVGYNGDRQKQIQKWQSNVSVPYTFATVETLIPRILDARPEFTVKGRTADDQRKSTRQQQLIEYNWEKANMDNTSELLTRASLVYGTGYLHAYWKKDVRKLKFLKGAVDGKSQYKEEEKVYYDAPYAEWVDNYSLWYDWRNIDAKNKQYWFKRLVLPGSVIKRRYPYADKKRLTLALGLPGGDLKNYASIRNEVKSDNEDISDKVKTFNSGIEDFDSSYNGDNEDLRMYEVIEWYKPFEDSFSVLVGGSYVPILKKGEIPFQYDFKESPFIPVPYLKLNGEFEGVGIPEILENPQIMLNMIKNQRLDCATLNIHKMWIVNPMANIRKDDLVVRPFGIIYSPDTQGVREVQFSDVKQSAYREEELLKEDMRYSAGVDDASMAVGGGAASATEVRHLRESTLERVRLFINHLADGFTTLMRFWLDMHRQFYTKEIQLRVLGENGEEEYPLVEKDDLSGYFDYRALVQPSISGQLEVKKKQDMDLFQLLSQLPFIDLKKLTAKLLSDFNWDPESIYSLEGQQVPGAEGQQLEGEMPPEMMALMAGEGDSSNLDISPDISMGKGIPRDVLLGALSKLRKPGESPNKYMSQFSEASLPINLLMGGNPPTSKDATKKTGKTTNIAGFNMGGKPNTNINMNMNSNTQSALLNRAFNIQS